jgi:hypothetical protein
MDLPNKRQIQWATFDKGIKEKDYESDPCNKYAEELVYYIHLLFLLFKIIPALSTCK